MPTPILMPALSPTMEEGTLSKWLVKEGDEVSSGDVIAEIETDKATMEVEAVDEGRIGKIMVSEGSEGVKVNEPIAVLLEEGETDSDIDEASLNSSGNGSSGGTGDSDAVAKQAAKDENAETTAQVNGAAPDPTPIQNSVSGDRVKASPLAKRMARNEGIDLNRLNGSGPHGRIVKRDIEKALEEGIGKPADKQSPATQVSVAATVPVAGALDERLYPADSYEAIKNDGMRKTIAKRLGQSFNQEVPHFPLNIDCELDELLAFRKDINAMSPEKGADGYYKISVNDLIIKASALALKRVPAANASYTDEAIIRHKHADIGVAVAIDGGLITPIVWKAETKGLVQISEEIKDMAARAKDKKLKPEEYQGGTFSVSNLGMFGIKSFASIVNQPQGAIMSVGAGEQRPVVKDGALDIATMMTVTLTCDHRVVDGAVGAEFLAAFKRFIEQPKTMLL
ncbi:MAG: pyruvate dehydrogenase complex dihydrolipoamide acetyltransferase [Aquisalinus sp.]|nr:pyruvate dehydrogenase complex dihydrolipoamide acetyltransferase [Aquisalinus sp.]